MVQHRRTEKFGMPAYIWISFFVFIMAVIALDLGVFHRKAHVVSLPEALGWTAVWIALALVFNALVYLMYSEGGIARPALALEQLTGQEAALAFFAGYVTEKSLSVDNVFVIAMIFAYFGVPLIEQHRLLMWGVIGALVLRAVMIALGVVLIERFSWMHYVFGVILILSAGKMMIVRHDTIDPGRNLIVRLVRRFYPVSQDFDGSRFFTRIDGERAVTPLFLALILIETTDLIFAVDSIPAIFAITRDPFLVWTSNVFALLGLRSLYFALAGLMHRFRYLKMSLVFLLVYVGIKILLTDYYQIPIEVSLAMIGGILLVGMGASVLAGGRDTAALISPLADQLEELVITTVREARRVVVLLIGSTIVTIGAVMLVLPGPGIPIVFLGLTVLAFEFAWARRWLADIRRRVADVQAEIRRTFAPGRESGRPHGDSQ